ncbi:MAG: murein transglycosylase [Alphaproteobacteria bacterium]|nr:murein transglycosylase [Alphaproteobacteria bacterium]
MNQPSATIDKNTKIIISGIAVILLLMLSYCLFPSEEVPPTTVDEPIDKEIIKTKYKPISFTELPGWNKDKIEEALPALRKSCIKVVNLPDDYDFKINANISLAKWKKGCTELNEFSTFSADAKTVKEHILKWYTPHKVKPKGIKEGTFTGYYEATINASYSEGGKYNVPIYNVPENLFKIDLSAFDAKAKKTNYIARADNGKAVPYYVREEINNGTLKFDGIKPILWADSLVDLFIMQIQGSAIAKMDDGTKLRIGYAGHNGKKFVGIGRYMKEKGLIKSLDMISIRKWLYENPKGAKYVMNMNPRYIFSRITNANGAIGAFGLELTPKRSMAVDPRYIPLGMPLWLNTKAPDGKPLQRLMIAQDTGSAIKGPIRGDFFWGSGEDALSIAGSMKSKGNYYVLLPVED